MNIARQLLAKGIDPLTGGPVNAVKAANKPVNTANAANAVNTVNAPDHAPCEARIAELEAEVASLKRELAKRPVEALPQAVEAGPQASPSPLMEGGNSPGWQSQNVTADPSPLMADPTLDRLAKRRAAARDAMRRKRQRDSGNA